MGGAGVGTARNSTAVHPDVSKAGLAGMRIATSPG
jgi:hypothetical protein